MIKAIIKTTWIGNGEKGNAIRPKFTDDYNVTWSDNGDGTLTITVTQDQLDAIESEDKYQIISSEVITED